MTAKAQTHEGLEGQIKYMEESIEIGEALGKDKSYERMLVKEWKRYLPGGNKHHLWLAYSHEGSHDKEPAEPPR